MRPVLIVAVLTCVTGCGGNATVSSPTAPSTAAGRGHTTLPTPLPAPSPGTPGIPGTPGTVPSSLIGTWAGTAVVVTSFVANSYNSCAAVLFVTGQATGQFFGFLQFTGGTVKPCGQSGPAYGSVGSTGAVSLSFNLTGGDRSQCSSIADTAPLTGLVSGDTMTVSQTVHRTCSSSSSDYSQDGIQSLSLSLRK